MLSLSLSRARACALSFGRGGTARGRRAALIRRAQRRLSRRGAQSSRSTRTTARNRTLPSARTDPALSSSVGVKCVPQECELSSTKSDVIELYLFSYLHKLLSDYLGKSAGRQGGREVGAPPAPRLALACRGTRYKSAPSWRAYKHRRGLYLNTRPSTLRATRAFKSPGGPRPPSFPPPTPPPSPPPASAAGTPTARSPPP